MVATKLKICNRFLPAAGAVVAHCLLQQPAPWKPALWQQPVGFGSYVECAPKKRLAAAAAIPLGEGDGLASAVAIPLEEGDDEPEARRRLRGKQWLLLHLWEYVFIWPFIGQGFFNVFL